MIGIRNSVTQSDGMVGEMSVPSMFSVSAEDSAKLANLHVPIPVHERDRLLIIRQCKLLDSVADESYDRITRICARVFKVEVPLIPYRQSLSSSFFAVPLLPQIGTFCYCVAYGRR